MRILSGVYQGRTTGTPIAMMIDNVDVRSGDYPTDAPPRPGHADAAYDAKYGLRDPRGGGTGLGARDGDAGGERRGGAAGHP